MTTLDQRTVDAGEWAHVTRTTDYETSIRSTTRFSKPCLAWCVVRVTRKDKTDITAFRNKQHAESWLEVCQACDARRAMIERMRTASRTYQNG